MLDSNLSWSFALPRTFKVLRTPYNSHEIMKPTFSQTFSSVSFTNRMKRVYTARCYRVSHWQHPKIIFPTKRLCLPKITALFFQIISTPGGAGTLHTGWQVVIDSSTAHTEVPTSPWTVWRMIAGTPILSDSSLALCAWRGPCSYLFRLQMLTQCCNSEAPCST
jgi:hypothetical protein